MSRAVGDVGTASDVLDE